MKTIIFLQVECSKKMLAGPNLRFNLWSTKPTASTKCEPIMRCGGQRPQQGSGEESLVMGAKALWSWKPFSFSMSHESGKITPLTVSLQTDSLWCLHSSIDYKPGSLSVCIIFFCSHYFRVGSKQPLTCSQPRAVLVLSTHCAHE